jgi:hypothetical protein
MRHASAAHRLVHLAQSALLQGVMAAAAWAIPTTVGTADLALLVAPGMIAGPAFVPVCRKGSSG